MATTRILTVTRLVVDHEPSGARTEQVRSPVAWRLGMSTNQQGFTLIELIFVLLIISLVTSVVVVRITPAREKAVVARKIGQLKHLLDWAQVVSKQQARRIEFEYSVDANRVTFHRSQDEDADQRWLEFGNSFQLAEVVSALPAAGLSKKGDVFSTDARGLLPTHAAKFVRKSKKPLWILICSSGEMMESVSEAEVRWLLEGQGAG